jgi:hypothetical protein
MEASKDDMEKWHVIPDITYGNILSMLVFVGSMGAVWGAVQARMDSFEAHLTDPVHVATVSRLNILEMDMARVETVDAAMQTRFEDLQKQIISRLDRQDAAMVRIEERLDEYNQNNR